MKVCLNCPKEFEPKKPKAKFCSVTCRVQFHRKQGKPEMVTIEKRKFDELMAALDKSVIGTSFEVKELKGILPHSHTSKPKRSDKEKKAISPAKEVEVSIEPEKPQIEETDMQRQLRELKQGFLNTKK